LASCTIYLPVVLLFYATSLSKLLSSLNEDICCLMFMMHYEEQYVLVKLSVKLLVKCKLSWWSTQWSENCLGETWWWANYVLTMVRCNLAITWGNSLPQIYILIFHGCSLRLQSLHCFWKNSTILTFSDKYNSHPNFSLLVCHIRFHLGIS
jgi:hypothetical protein